MNINTRSRVIAYLSICLFFFLLLVREYTYIHPYNTGYGLLGPGWTYISTRTITWWFILIGSIVLVTSLIRIQKIGLLGLFLSIAVFVRPFIQYKFPQETAIEFYRERAINLKRIVNQYEDDKDRTIMNKEITDLDLDRLDISKGTYYFLLYDPMWAPNGICYDKDGKLPQENFGRDVEYVELDNNWYEFDCY